MRIISGRLGGRTFDAPSGHKTHPMSDKVRGALFSALGDISGLDFLDAFAGSGGIGYEALSRGAASVLAVENDKTAQRTIGMNARQMELQAYKLIKANVSSWSDNNADRQFAVVVADPPYDRLQLSTLEKLVRHVKPGGLYVLSWPGKAVLPHLNALELVTTKTYGDAQIGFYRR